MIRVCFQIFCLKYFLRHTFGFGDRPERRRTSTIVFQIWRNRSFVGNIVQT